MDDPSQRPPVPPPALPPADGYGAPPVATQPQPPPGWTPQPSYPAQPAYLAHPAQVQMQHMPPGMPAMSGMPAMPPVPPMGTQFVAPGVSVQISNVVVAPQPAYPVPYGAPAPSAPGAPGVVDLIRNDAQQRAMDAVARRGPARVLGLLLGVGGLVMLAGLLMSLIAGASGVAVAIAAVPVVVVAVAGFTLAARAGRGVEGHHLEQAILELASRNQGEVRVVGLAQHTGRPLRECQTAIDAMVSSGHATVEADEGGSLLYRIPDLEPRRRILVAGSEIGGR